ncbi:hypothetical protein KJ570_01445 [Patescibacteria group bacterium]|nr:hypothetical protein [Patescibacteria group bacterium]MBU2036435.1 hypothetical protein [Patescibacteria group bacterium]
MIEKIIGYILLFFGVMAIILSGLNAFNILTRKSNPIEFINKEIVSTITPGEPSKNPISLNQMLNIDNDTIALITNIGIHLLILGFIMKAGFHLASLGTMLVRPIVVDLNSKLPTKKGLNGKR